MLSTFWAGKIDQAKRADTASKSFFTVQLYLLAIGRGEFFKGTVNKIVNILLPRMHGFFGVGDSGKKL